MGVAKTMFRASQVGSSESNSAFSLLGSTHRDGAQANDQEGKKKRLFQTNYGAKMSYLGAGGGGPIAISGERLKTGKRDNQLIMLHQMNESTIHTAFDDDEEESEIRV
jgi:hypothetical protein